MEHIIISNIWDANRVFSLIDLLLLILCLSATWFYCYAIYAAIDFFGRPSPINADFQPPVSILKPICGLDSDAYENLASFCHQDYPEYQIIFAVREQEDPSIKIVQRLMDNFPNIDIRLVISGRTIGTNFKVSNLANAQTEAKHSILLIADSDIRVGSDYLQQVMEPMADPTVGVVTCLFRTITCGWVANLEALGTSTEFHPSVLVGRKIDGMKFALGSTIVIRKVVLETIGGFAAIADYLADDFQLGKLPAAAGYKVVLSNYVVEHVIAKTNIADSLKRQTRWARGTRVSRPWGYVGLIFTHGIATSLLLLVATGGSILGWVGLAVTWSTRLLMAWVVGVKYLQDPVVKRFLWLVPVGDLLSFMLWCYSFVGNAIEWRGRRLKLTKGGKLIPITTDFPQALSN